MRTVLSRTGCRIDLSRTQKSLAFLCSTTMHSLFAAATHYVPTPAGRSQPERFLGRKTSEPTRGPQHPRQITHRVVVALSALCRGACRSGRNMPGPGTYQRSDRPDRGLRIAGQLRVCHAARQLLHRLARSRQLGFELDNGLVRPAYSHILLQPQTPRRARSANRGFGVRERGQDPD